MLWIQARAAGTSASCKNARSADEQLVVNNYTIDKYIPPCFVNSITSLTVLTVIPF